MKRKSILVTVLASIFAVFVFSGCTVSPSALDVAAIYGSYSKSVEVKSSFQLREGYDYSISWDVYPDSSSYYDYLHFSSSNTWVATVDKYGNVKGENEGTAMLYLKVDGCSTEAVWEVTVTDHVVTATYDVYSVSLNHSSISLDINEECTLIPEVLSTWSFTNHDVTWSSDNSSVATVSSDGVVKGVGAGSATITAISVDNPGESASCSVTVSSTVRVNIESITISGSKTSIYKGEETELTATVVPSDVDIELTWSQMGAGQVILTPSDDSKTCTVRGLAVGSVMITAYSESSGGVIGSYSMSVVVNPSASADQFFWGTWIRMDKGTEIVIDENSVSAFDKEKNIIGTYEVYNSTDEELTVESLGTYTKTSDSVIQKSEGSALIPFFRKGGTNLSYSLKIVGFEDSLDGRSISRAAGTGKSDLKVRGNSKRFASFKDEGTTDGEGEVTLTAPIQGDVQTVTIVVDETDQSKDIIIDNLKVENNNDFLGTVAIVEDGDYSLKITGVIDEAVKDNGYLYAGNTYPLTVTISNISDVTSAAATAEVKPEDSSLMTLSCDKYNLNAFTIPTMKAGASISFNLNVTISEDNFNDAYVDTKINVKILNGRTKRTWVDYIPLRIYKTTTNFTIAATSPQFNRSSALNGFLIYPDGNSQYFSVPAEEDRTISAPLFKEADDYILVFSGATVLGDLDNSTELYYTLSIDSTVKKDFGYQNIDNIEQLADIMYFAEDGRGNDIEKNAYAVSNNFEAYLAEGDIDFYKININSSKINNSIVTIPSYTDINVLSSYDSENDSYVLTADDSYDSYVWKIENVKSLETSNVLVINNADLSDGITKVFVQAIKGENIRSKTLFIRKR